MSYKNNIFKLGLLTGIGKVPTEKLDIEGNLKANSFIKTGGVGNEILLDDGSTKAINEISGTSVQDKDGIEQFTGNDIRFENVEFDIPNNKIIVSPSYITHGGGAWYTYSFPQNTFGWTKPTNLTNNAFSSSSQTDEIQILTNNGNNTTSGADAPFPHFIAPFDMVLVSVNVTSTRDSLWDLGSDPTDVFEFFVGSVNRAHNASTNYYTKTAAQVLYKDTRTNQGGNWSYDNQDDNVAGTNFIKDGSNKLLIIPKGHSVLYAFRSTITDRSNALNIYTQLTFKKA